MTYAIVYDSRTGNTEELARAVAEALPAQGRLVFGRVGEVDAASVAQADRVYAGFWTNRGDCTDEMGELLAGLAGTGDWLEGERFRSSVSQEDVSEWVDSLGLSAE